MAKKPPPEKPKPKPIKNPCPTCGQPKGEHTLNQLTDCLARAN